MLPDRTDMMWGMALVPEQGTGIARCPACARRKPSRRRWPRRPELAESAVSIELNQYDTRLSREAGQAPDRRLRDI